MLMGWLSYHIAEEYIIAVICVLIALRAYRTAVSALYSMEIRSRLHLIGSGFSLLAINSAFHASIHAFRWSQNLLYQTLLGYCLGLLIIIIAISSEKPWNKKLLPLLYLPLLVIIHPDIYTIFPIFGQFRPLMWVIISYLSGVICMLYIAVYYRTEARKYLLSSLGHGLICGSAILLFFPSGIGSNPWIYGHLFRPLGFIILFFSMKQEDLTILKGSILYRTLTAFGLLASVPLFVYGTVMIYENITPINIMGRSMIVFTLLLVTLASALFFGLGLIINLLRPILQLKDSVSRLVDRDLDEKLDLSSNDEIGELSEAYNDMVVRLRHSISEKDRLSRLAATGELSATLAHEIKNPLHAIDVAATYLRNNYKGKLINEFIKIIQVESSRINKLTTSLLNFAKPVKAELTLRDINKLVAEMVSLLREESAERNIHIELKQELDTPVFSFDYNQIKQVLLNLLINAFDAVEGEGHITIETSSLNGNILLSVEDNGKGISEDDMENIFNPFYTTKTRGTGLGLAVSRKIAKEHGGDLIIDSSPEKGCRFTLILPFRS